MTYELCVIEGDGIGIEVIPAAVDVLRAVVPDLIVHPALGGWSAFVEYGTSLPQETLELAHETGAVLYGSASSPHYPVDGYFSPIVKLRRMLDAYTSLRPTRYLPIPTAKPGIDLVVAREATEDLYVGHEHTSADGMVGTAQKVITRTATERIARKTYELALATGREKVTIVHKANVLPQSDGLFRRVALEVAAEFPSIHTDELLVDTAAYWMVKDPSRFDIILTPNLYGDILSDMAAAWGGGLGFAPSLSVGDGVAIAEPVHGSAPDIAGRNIANPTAAILAGALLLRHHWHLPAPAQKIEDAIYSMLSDGYHTRDIYNENAMSTTEFADRVLARLD